MLVPTIVNPPQQPEDRDHRDLLTAIRLLSGQNCKRDAQQAQVLLLGLTESPHADIARDARSIMTAGLDRGWFDDKAPKYFDLTILAERSLKNHQSMPARRRQVMAVAFGLAFFVAGLTLFFVVQGGNAPQVPWVLLGLIGMAIVALLLFLQKR